MCIYSNLIVLTCQIEKIEGYMIIKKFLLFVLCAGTLVASEKDIVIHTGSLIAPKKNAAFWHEKANYYSEIHRAAKQAGYPTQPSTEELQQVIVESEIVQSRQLIPQLAPLIAAYADNTVRGYIALTIHSHACPLYRAHPGKGNTSEWLQSFSKEYPQSSKLNLLDWAVHNIFATGDPQFMAKLGQDDWVKLIASVPYEDCYIYPFRIPLRYLENKKEGDEVCFTLQGIPYVLICCQRALNQENPENFENALAKVEKHGP